MSQTDYERFRAFVLGKTGLDFPEDKRAMLGRGLAQVMQTTDCQDLDQLYTLLRTCSPTSATWDELIGALTVGETYFFRNSSHFDVLAKHVLPEIIAAREHTSRRIRIWSAGCASGEEPYSIAILLRELIPNLESWNILVLGTDINREALHRAREGRYNAWSFRGVEKRVQDTYFQQDGNQFVIADKIKRMVTLDYLNLVGDHYPSLANNTNAMDVILCRNVTIYFSAVVTQTVLHGFHTSLVDSGWLIPGPSEPNMIFYGEFEPRNFPGTVVYQKPAVAQVKPTPEWVFPTVLAQTAVSSPPVPSPVKPQFPEPAQKPVAPPPKRAAPPDPYKAAVELLQTGMADEALVKLYEKLDQDANFAPTYIALGKIFAKKGNLEEAQHWCERAIRLDKMHPEPYYTLSMVYQQHGLLDMAIDALKKTVYLDREFVLAHYNLAQIYRHQGEKTLARKSLENVQRLLQGKPKDTPVPEGDGLVTGRLIEIVETSLALED